MNVESALKSEIQLRIIADNNSVISEGEILHFDTCISIRATTGWR